MLAPAVLIGGCNETPEKTSKVKQASFNNDQEAREIEKLYAKLKTGLLERELKEEIGVKPFVDLTFPKAGKRELYLIEGDELDSKGTDYFKTLKEVTEKGKPALIVEYSAFGDAVYIAKRIINRETVELDANRFWFYESNAKKPETTLKNKVLAAGDPLVKKFDLIGRDLSKAWQGGGDLTIDELKGKLGGGSVLSAANNQTDDKALVYIDGSPEVASWAERDDIFFKRPGDKTRNQIIVWSDAAGVKSATLIHWQKIEETNDGEVLAYWTENTKISKAGDLKEIDKSLAEQKAPVQY